MNKNKKYYVFHYSIYPEKNKINIFHSMETHCLRTKNYKGIADVQQFRIT